MSSPNETNEGVSYTPLTANVDGVVGTTPTDSSQVGVGDSRTESDKETNQTQNDGVIKRKRQKTSAVWNDFDEVEMTGGVKKAVYKYCKIPLSTGGRGASTTHLKRHLEICFQRRLKLAGEKKQSVIPFQPSRGNTNPFLTPGAKFCNEKMREIISTAIMVHEYPFSIVEDEVLNYAFQNVNAEFQKVSRRTIRNDCLALYEAEKRKLKAQFEKCEQS